MPSVLQYVALVWNDADPAESDIARELTARLQRESRSARIILRQSGLIVRVSERHSPTRFFHSLSGQSGVILGALFKKLSNDLTSPSDELQRDLSEYESRQIISSNGAELIRRYWGNYVAFLVDQDRSTVTVLRGPVSFLPCFHLAVRGVGIYFSHLSDILALRIAALTINWDHVAVSFFSRAETEFTGLNEVKELRSGERIERAGPRIASHLLWNPVELATTDVIEDPELAARTVRETVTRCVQAWASSHKTILHMLSGGLDSSLILACLAELGDCFSVTCLNYHSPGFESDERHFARDAAKRSGCPLITLRRNPEIRFENVLLAAPNCRPTDSARRVEYSREIARVASEVGATAIFNGNGGDELFFGIAPKLCASDYAYRHGLNSQFFKLALKAAAVERLTLWHIVGQVVRDRLFPWRANAAATVFPRIPLMTDRALQIALDPRRSAPVWCRSTRRIPLGKIWQIQNLLVTRDPFDPITWLDDAERLEPLYSQPILELCIRIPTDVHWGGGIDRGIARRAFQDKLPASVLARSWKGGTEERIMLLAKNNMQLIRDVLGEGRLIAGGIIDADRLTAVLANMPAGAGREVTMLIRCLEVENWLRAIEKQQGRVDLLDRDLVDASCDQPSL